MSRHRLRRPLLLDHYRAYLDHQSPKRFARHVLEQYTQGTLERLAAHSSPEIRRAAVSALGLVADYEANHVLGRGLVDEDDTVRSLAEKGIRNVWTRAGNRDQRRALKRVMELIAGQQFEQAVREASELIDKTPWFAEAWNQRAIARFALKQYAESIRDCHQALEINPYHFPAAAGMGYAYAQLNNPVSALECFRRALRLNPNLDEIRSLIDRLRRRIGEK